MSAAAASQTKVTMAVRERSERGNPLLMVVWSSLAQAGFWESSIGAGGGQLVYIIDIISHKQLAVHAGLRVYAALLYACAVSQHG